MSTPIRFLIGERTIDLTKQTCDGQTLSELQCALLTHLVSRNEAVVSKEELYREVWGYRSIPKGRAVDFAIRRLRGIIEPAPKTPQYLETVRGRGFRLQWTELQPVADEPAPSESMPPTPIGASVPIAGGRYVLLEPLGEGGWATVWRAKDTRLGIHRAVKLLAPDQATDPSLRRRFELEARVMARLDHPQIVKVHDVGDDGETCFFVMDLHEQGTLAERLTRHGVLEVAQAIQVGLSLCGALHHAHTAGVIHRDIKPANILLDDRGRCYLTDFGMARQRVLEASLIHSGGPVGSYAYMSPEQRESADQVGPASDIYSIGVMLYTLVTAALPNDLYEAAARETYFESLPPAFAEVLTKCCAATPEERYPSALALEIALQDCLPNVPEPQGVSAPLFVLAAPTPQPVRACPEVEALPPEGIITLVSTDIRGSSRLWEWLGPAFGDILELHNTLLRESLSAHAGYHVKSEGDSFVVSFDEVSAAIAFCLDAQLKLFEASWLDEALTQPELTDITGTDLTQGFNGVRVRMGVHTGQPQCRVNADTGHTDYLGRMVGRTNRIADAAHGGQILLSAITYSLLEPASFDAAWTDLGPHALAEAVAPERLYQVLPNALKRRCFPPPRTPQPTTNLPRPANVIIGRQEVFEVILGAILNRDPLISLVGPGGAGKTRLAVEAANVAREAFSGGVWTVDLIDCRTTLEVFQVFETVIGWDEGQTGDTGAPLLKPGEPVLFVINHFEHLIPYARDVLSRLQSIAPHSVCLFTSQAPLRLLGERVILIPPLAVPAASATLDEARESPSVSLFVHHAKEVKGEFVLSQDNVADIIAIVRLLGGLPLAIELAAARSRALSPSKLKTRLRDRFKTLRRSRASGPSRQSSLKATIDWSWGLLEPWEQAALTQCAAHQRPFEVDEIESIVDLSEWPDAPWPVDVVETLLERSLMTFIEIEQETQLVVYENIAAYVLNESLSLG